MDCRMPYRSFWVPELKGLNPFTEMAMDIFDARKNKGSSVFHSRSSNPKIKITVDFPNNNLTFERMDLMLSHFLSQTTDDLIEIRPNEIQIEIDGVVVLDSRNSSK